MPHSALARAAATLVTLTALVGATLTAPTAQAADGGDRKAGTQTSAKIAARALDRAQTALAGKGGDATMALRDLWLQRDSLSPADRAAYAKLVTRPVKTNVLDGGNIRVHYNPGELSNFSAADVLNTSVSVSQFYSNAGYRQPKSDQGLGGSNAVDIYVDQLPLGLYGLCTTDQPTQSGPGRYDVWAYCIVDNDYAGFPTNTPLENLQVTVAHEYFHATQFAYDFADDGWAMEATAAWVEDEAYDAVDDNVQYLQDSPITNRKRSMDKFGGLYHYGVWIFFRYLTQAFPKERGGLPEIILDFWKAADSSKGAKKDKYFTQGMNSVLGKGKYKKLPLDRAFALFADTNRRAKSFYDEGQVNNYPQRKLSGQKKLGGKGSSKTFTAKLDHLTSSTYRYLPKAGGKLKVSVAGAPKGQGTRAVVSIWKKSGKVKQKYLAISAKGRGQITVPFAKNSIEAIEVTLVNASVRYTKCYVNSTLFSCSGKPTDQDKRISVTGRVV